MYKTLPLLWILNDLKFACKYKFALLFCHHFQYVHRIKTFDNDS